MSPLDVSGEDVRAEATKERTAARALRRRAETKVRVPFTGTRRLVYLADATLHLVGRELAGRYRRSLFGWLWSLAPPLTQLAVFHFVFSRVIPLEIENFAVFLLVGILAWNLFASGLTLATGSLEAQRHLVLRPGFPTILLPVVSVLVAFVDYLLALPVLLVAVAATVGLAPSALLLLPLLAAEVLLTVALALFLAPLNVYFRDVRHFVGVAVLLGFWLTPVFYARETVPERFRAIYDVNPLAHLLEAQRDVLLDGGVPSLAPLALVLVGSLLVLVAGGAVFQAYRHSLPEQL